MFRISGIKIFRCKNKYCNANDVTVFMVGVKGFEPARFIFEFFCWYSFRFACHGSIVWYSPITTESHHNTYTYHINAFCKSDNRNYEFQQAEIEGKYFSRARFSKFSTTKEIRSKVMRVFITNLLKLSV